MESMARGQRKRGRRLRQARRTYAIVVEGAEVEYRCFSALKSHFNQRQDSARMIVRRGNGGSFSQIVDRAIDEKQLGHSIVWCVADSDRYESTHGKEREKADRSVQRAHSQGVRLILSNPCFEIWFRLHFECTGAPQLDCERVKRHLRAIWPTYSLKPEMYFEQLLGKLETARENAKQVRKNHDNPSGALPLQNSSTTVDLLFDDVEKVDPNCFAPSG